MERLKSLWDFSRPHIWECSSPTPKRSAAVLLRFSAFSFPALFKRKNCGLSGVSNLGECRPFLWNGLRPIKWHSWNQAANTGLTYWCSSQRGCRAALSKLESEERGRRRWEGGGVRKTLQSSWFLMSTIFERYINLGLIYCYSPDCPNDFGRHTAVASRRAH